MMIGPLTILLLNVFEDDFGNSITRDKISLVLLYLLFGDFTLKEDMVTQLMVEALEDYSTEIATTASVDYRQSFVDQIASFDGTSKSVSYIFFDCHLFPKNV